MREMTQPFFSPTSNRKVILNWHNRPSAQVTSTAVWTLLEDDTPSHSLRDNRGPLQFGYFAGPFCLHYLLAQECDLVSRSDPLIDYRIVDVKFSGTVSQRVLLVDRRSLYAVNCPHIRQVHIEIMSLIW